MPAPDLATIVRDLAAAYPAAQLELEAAADCTYVDALATDAGRVALEGVEREARAAGYSVEPRSTRPGRLTLRIEAKS
jgi:hypothetical protein